MSVPFHKYEIGDELEYLPTDDSFYSFAWYPVKVVQCGEKSIGTRHFPYYVIQWGEKDTVISVEEWQLRLKSEPNTYSTLDAETKVINSGTIVECSVVVNEMKAWFIGKVVSKCQPTSSNIMVEYYNQKWHESSMTKKNKKGETITYRDVPKTSCRYVFKEDHISHRIAEGRIPPRLLSDEEHLMTSFYEDFLKIKEECNKGKIKTAEEFEKKREEAVDIADSFVNARHYESAIGVISWIKEIEKQLA